jgi:sigma-B regulation protein RsbU (phosphoserine phosphatase)
MFKEQKFATCHVEFASGDMALLVTDGLTEAANENDEEYGLERVKQQMTRHSGDSLKVLCDTVLKDARKFGKQTDDISLLLVRRLSAQ